MHACTRTSWRGVASAGSLNEQGVPRTTVTTAPTHLSRPYTSHVHVQCSAIMVPRGCDLFYMLDSRARARYQRCSATNQRGYSPWKTANRNVLRVFPSRSEKAYETSITISFLSFFLSIICTIFFRRCRYSSLSYLPNIDRINGLDHGARVEMTAAFTKLIKRLEEIGESHSERSVNR